MMAGEKLKWDIREGICNDHQVGETRWWREGSFNESQNGQEGSRLLMEGYISGYHIVMSINSLALLLQRIAKKDPLTT